MYVNLNTMKAQPAGTILEVQARAWFLEFPHPGALAYDWYGRPVMLHNSKRTGRGAVSTLEEFADSQTPRVVYVPSVEKGAQIVSRAVAEVESWEPWSLMNNCQDFVSRAVTGHDGSPSRDTVIAFLLVAFGVGVALAED